MILVVALLVLLPLLLDAVVGCFDRVQGRFGSAATRIAVVELRSPETRVRSLAIAATGAIAVFGSVAIQGAQANLQHGVDRVAHEIARAADLWIVPPGARICSARRRSARRPPPRSRGFPGCGRSAPIERGSSTSATAASGCSLPRRPPRSRFPPSQLAQGEARAGRLRGFAPAAGRCSPERSRHSSTCASARPSRCPRRSPTVLRVAALTHEPQLAPWGDHPQPARLRARLRERRARRLQRDALAQAPTRRSVTQRAAPGARAHGRRS